MNRLIKHYQLIFLLALSLLILTGCTMSHTRQLSKGSKDWAMWGGNYAGTRYSELDDINTKNVHKLSLAWVFPTQTGLGHEGGPLIVNDVIYIHTPFPNRVYALNQSTQKVIWEYRPSQNAVETIVVMSKGFGTKGLAYADGKIFLQQADTVLIALDAKTGQHLWRTKTGDPKIGMSNTNAPIVVKDKVITGISGGDFGVQGFLAAYDINDGHLIWKGYSTGSDQQTLIAAGKTTTWRKGKVTPLAKDESINSWEAEQWKVGGGTAWGWYTYDPEPNLIYYGSGSPAPWNSLQRPGDNKWTNALWARDADTGEVEWVYQMTPHDESAYGGVNESVLIDQEINGQLRKTLVHFDENGFSYVLDRVTGELLQAEKFNKSVNWASHIDLFSGRPQRVAKFSPEINGEDANTLGLCPSLLGSKGKSPVSYSPQTGLFYISGNHACMEYEPFEVSHSPGQPYVGATTSIQPAKVDVKTGNPNGSKNFGVFTAWDAKKGKIAWSNDEPFHVESGSLATAGNLVFYGTLEGYLKAVDARTGKELFKFKTPSGNIGNVNTWRYQGRQYIGVLSGVGRWSLLSDGYPTNRVFSVFTLPDERLVNTLEKTYSTTYTAKIKQPINTSINKYCAGELKLSTQGELNSFDRSRLQNTYQRKRLMPSAKKPFSSVLTEPMSTFLFNVDKNLGCRLEPIGLGDLAETIPFIDPVKIEELINFFYYKYPSPKDAPFSISTELSIAPWNPKHRLLHIGVKGEELSEKPAPASSLTFLINVSEPEQNTIYSEHLENLQHYFYPLIDQLNEKDTLSIIIFSDDVKVVLPATKANKKDIILNILKQLKEKGSLSSSSRVKGIEQAYKEATKNYILGGNNQIILVTGKNLIEEKSHKEALINLIAINKEQGIVLNILEDESIYSGELELFATNEKINYAFLNRYNGYYDKPLTRQLMGASLSIAKEVKLQLEFNPETVKSYKLIGYKDLLDESQYFDKWPMPDGESIASGHAITALYEIIPKSDDFENPAQTINPDNKLANIKLRYQKPGEEKVRLIEQSILDQHTPLADTSNNYRFAAGVAEFGLILSKSKFKAQANYAQVLSLLEKAKGVDQYGRRSRFISLVKKTKALSESDLQ